LQIEPVDTGSRIDVISDIDLTGRIASLGRGIRDVSNQMFTAFADELTDRIEQPGQSAPPAAGAAGGNGQRHVAGVRTATEETPHIAARQRPASTTGGGEIKVMALIWSVTRERLAGFLDRLAARVRPN
jgi:hypothetical protein